MGLFGQLGGDKHLLDNMCNKNCKLIIYTAREMTNRTDDRQYGYESSQFYKNVEKKFYSLCSKVKLTRSFEQVWQLTNNIQEKNIVSCYVKTKWSAMIEEVLQKSFDIVQNLRKNSVLIHCPSGADGSSVLSSLAQLILDPYYRTFEGFKVLVYKEWLFFQHNFARKHALVLHGSNGEPVNGHSIAADMKASQRQMQHWFNINNCKDYGPFFIFFLDCVSQLIRMNSNQFEFTSHYLAHIAFNCHTNKFYELTSPIISVDPVTNKNQPT